MPVVPVLRFRALDSMRGLAAMIVVAAHLSLVSAIPDAAHPQQFHLTYWVVPFYMGSRFAVLLFFVLSGFVLALPYFAGTNPSYPAYLMRRFWRLYPPFAFAVLIAALLCTLLAGTSVPVNSAWLNAFWSTAISRVDLVTHLLMLGIHPSSTRIDSTIWSLIIEMRVSILFPLLVLFVRRFGPGGVALSFVVAWICAKLRGEMGELSVFTANSFAGVLFLTMYYVPFFLLGVLAAAHLNSIKTFVRRSPAGYAALFVMMTMFWIVMGYLRYETSGYLDLFYGLIALYLIIACVSFPSVSHLLTGRLCLWLGDISYSLYLIHLPILLSVFYLTYNHLSSWMIAGLAYPVILLGAHVMHYAIEKPSIKIGRNLASRLDDEAAASQLQGRGRYSRQFQGLIGPEPPHQPLQCPDSERS